MNENYLYLMECPRCGQDKEFIIDCSICMCVVDDGMTPVGDELPSFNESSYCRCSACEYEGKVKDFTFPYTED